MGFFQAITDIFDSIFRSSSPEVKKKLELRKLENEIKAYQPVLYKNEYLQPNFGELFRSLYENTKTIGDILSKTICSGDLHRNGKFEYQLILTGFSPEDQEELEKLNYENRKIQIEKSDSPINKVFEKQRHTFEHVLKHVNNPDFSKIDDTIAKLHRLSDICNYNTMNVIHAFDPAFSGHNPSEFNPSKPVPPEAIDSSLMDLYYLSAGFSLDASCIRGVTALKQLLDGEAPSDTEREQITGNLKKISMILTKILNPEILKKIICLAKKDPAFVPQAASYNSTAIKKFLEYVQGRFTSDEERIKAEIKDFTISFELKKLFPDRDLLELQGYNNATNDLLRASTPYSLLWITPLQTIKTFLQVYFSDAVKSVLNNIVIEGFFNNSNYKSDFSQMVYTCCESEKRMAEFEKSFDHGGKNDTALIQGYVDDSRKDADFLKKLAFLIDEINEQAHAFIQEEANNFFTLYKQIGELILDSKKSKSDMVSNIKVLLSSSRNRDSSNTLEQQHASWLIFLKIMKNYAIVGELEDKNEQ